MVARRRHTRYLAKELCTGIEIIVIPVTVVTLTGDKVTIHEGNIAIKTADEILHVRPVVACITVNIADGEDTIRRTLFRSRLGPTDLRITTISVLSDREVIACVRLQIRQSNDMHITLVCYQPTIAGGNLHIKVCRVCTVVNQCFCRCGLFGHLPEHFDGVSSRSHRIGFLVRLVWIVVVVIRFSRNAPTRITEVGTICSCGYSRTVSE